IIASQLVFLRSRDSSFIQMGLGVLSWSAGASRKLIEILQRCALSSSYPTVSNIVESLATSSVDEARVEAVVPHMMCYDNINIETSIHVEQTSKTPNKMQSGSFVIIYPLYLSDPTVDLKLSPILERQSSARHLKMADLRPSNDAATSYIDNTTRNIVKILLRYITGFKYLQHDPLLQNKPRRRLPRDLRTRFYPLRATTIEEATVEGNLLIHDDTYKDQLKFNTEQLNKDPSPGLFHTEMNLDCVVHNTHRGTIQEAGSLSHFYLVMGKTRLGSDKPDYHTLITAQMQILDGLILNSWRIECGDLDQYAETKPSPEQLLEKARDILKKYGTPPPAQEVKTKSKAKPKAPSTEPVISVPQPKPDITFSNIILLTRDLLYLDELRSAIKDGDFGRIEDILPILACLFRGAGSNNYSMELLHLIHNLKVVWTPEFA
ncbi:hypothetical protein BJ165DRAFT_1356573, partial [Panaeolus papilionaceus]